MGPRGSTQKALWWLELVRSDFFFDVGKDSDWLSRRWATVVGH